MDLRALPPGKTRMPAQAAGIFLFYGAKEAFVSFVMVGLVPAGLREVDGTLNWLQSDHLASVRLMTNGSGAVIAENHYRPYGQRTELLAKRSICRVNPRAGLASGTTRKRASPISMPVTTTPSSPASSPPTGSTPRNPASEQTDTHMPRITRWHTRIPAGTNLSAPP